jgi:hypothetical protein
MENKWTYRTRLLMVTKIEGAKPPGRLGGFLPCLLATHQAAASPRKDGNPFLKIV